jgi:uncharacterized repeat protein (TIGR03803 family)
MRILQLLLIVAVVGTSIPLGLAQDSSSFKTLYSFTGQTYGGDPVASLVIGSGGVLYGTTYGPPPSNRGTVFSLTPPASHGGSWTETVLHDFTGGDDGGNPWGGVVIGAGGVLYGTTIGGGTSSNGTVFSLTPPTSPGGAWTEAVLHDFQHGNVDGVHPRGSVVIGAGGVIYGTTYNGGVSLHGCGTVFSLTPPASQGGSWTEAVLHKFLGGSDGCGPNAGVVIGSGGALYGTTEYGGTSNSGTVYSLTPPASPGGAWTETVLHNFAGRSDGANPQAGVVIGKDGLLYGTTFLGGTSNLGTVFSLTPPTSPGGAWTETVLYSFTGGNDGADLSAGAVIGSGRVLYGTTSSGGTSNAGTVFSLTPPASPGGTWTETVLHSFTGGDDGDDPVGALVIGGNGVLYGTTSSGGASNAGTVFALKP